MSTIGPLPPFIEGDLMASSGVFTQNVRVFGSLQAEGFKSVGTSKTMDTTLLSPVTRNASYTTATTPSFSYANILNGLFVPNVTADSLTFMLPPAATFVDGLKAESLMPAVGDCYAMDVFNAGTNSISFATSAGVTVMTNTSALFTTAAPGSTLKFVLTNVSVGSEAYTVYRV